MFTKYLANCTLKTFFIHILKRPPYYMGLTYKKVFVEKKLKRRKPVEQLFQWIHTIYRYMLSLKNKKNK